MKTKQVIIIRRDLKMRRGKEIAQSCHASNAILLNNLVGYPFKWHKFPFLLIKFVTLFLFNKPFRSWITDSFTKVCVYVNSEQELLDVYLKAKKENMLCSLIKDSGKTEFHGVATYTAVCVGPDTEERVNLITGNLPLY